MQDINKLIETISKEYYIDYNIFNYDCEYNFLSLDRYCYIQSTIKLYHSNHPELDTIRIKKALDTFNEIVKDDLVVRVDITFIFLELYKILYLLNNTFKSQNILNNFKRYPNKFAYIQSDTQKINEARKQYKKNIIGKSKLGYRGESRLRYGILTLFVKNRNITQFFLHNFLIADILKVRLLYQEDDKTQEIILSVLNYFLTQKTNIDAVVKNLAILLYFEMKNYLYINKDNAEIYTKEIIYNLFNSNINMHEFNQRITLDSSIEQFPIFGSSKKRKNAKKRKRDLSIKEEKFIESTIKQELKRINIDIDDELFTKSFEQFIKNPHIQFLQKYPVELFRINPKYSS